MIDRAIRPLREILGLAKVWTEDLHAGKIRTTLIKEISNGQVAETSRQVIDHQDPLWREVDCTNATASDVQHVLVANMATQESRRL